MTPTNRLRWVERKVRSGPFEAHTIRVLQQWWEDKESSRLEPAGEWRDVPLGVEK